MSISKIGKTKNWATLMYLLSDYTKFSKIITSNVKSFCSLFSDCLSRNSNATYNILSITSIMMVVLC